MRVIRWSVGVLVVGLVLAACGGSGSMDSAETAPMPAGGSVIDKPDREIIRNGEMSVRVDDVRVSAGQVRVVVEQAGGRLSGESINAMGESLYADITARVPADQLDAVIGQVGALGTVMSLNVYAEDVTAQGADLDARIAALQTSVDRLSQLLAQAQTTKDLVEIEGELTERQAELDSLVAQRAALSDAVALSTLTVRLSPSSEAVTWAPPGFASGLESGWSAMRTMVAGLITLAGFVLPFALLGLVVVAPVIAIIVLLGRRRRKSTRG